MPQPSSLYLKTRRQGHIDFRTWLFTLSLPLGSLADLPALGFSNSKSGFKEFVHIRFDGICPLSTLCKRATGSMDKLKELLCLLCFDGMLDCLPGMPEKPKAEEKELAWFA